MYEWDGAWSQKGSVIKGESSEDQSGWSVSLSNDGLVLAIGGCSGDGSASGHVRVYEWNGTDWFQIGSDIDGDAAGDDSGHSVSLSGDGSIVAIGAPFNDKGGNNTDNWGHVKVLKLERSHGHISNFSYRPISLNLGFFASVSNRKEHHDDWQEGPVSGVKT